MKCTICGKNINKPSKWLKVNERCWVHWMAKHRKTHRELPWLEYFKEKGGDQIK